MRDTLGPPPSSLPPAPAACIPKSSRPSPLRPPPSRVAPSLEEELGGPVRPFSTKTELSGGGDRGGEGWPGRGRQLRATPRGRSAGAGRGGVSTLLCPPRTRWSGCPALPRAPGRTREAGPGQSHWGWKCRGKKRPALSPPLSRSPYPSLAGLRGPGSGRKRKFCDAGREVRGSAGPGGVRVSPSRRESGQHRGQVTAMTTRVLQGGRVPRSLAEGSFVSRCTFHPAPRGKGEEEGKKKSLHLIIAANDGNSNSPFWSYHVHPCVSFGPC